MINYVYIYKQFDLIIFCPTVKKNIYIYDQIIIYLQ